MSSFDSVSVAEAPTSDSPKPFLTIRPTSGWSAINIQQLWLFRDLLFSLAQRDIKLRYKQTALGAIWVILQPMLTAGILTLVFSVFAKLPTNGVNPFLFTYAGSLAFSLFSSSLTKVSGSLIGSAQLISKVFFPRLLLPLSTVISTLLDFVVSLGMFAVLLIFFRVSLTPAILLMPILVVLMLMLSLGFGMVAASLIVSYRDVQYVLPVMVQLLTFASPVGYSAAYVVNERLPESLRPFYFLLNPLAALLEAFRYSVLGSGQVPWGYVAYAAVISIASFVAGAFIFKRMERKFADVI